MKVGARNQIQGTVKKIKRGAVMAEVQLDVTAAEMASVMTVSSVEDMHLEEGDRVRVVVKAIHVLLLKD